jgi:DNA-binding response OmpR family regulator
MNAHVSLSELDRLRAENVRLRGEVAELKAAYEGDTDERVEAVFRSHFGFTRAEAWLLALLYRANGRTVSAELIVSEIPGFGGRVRDDRDPVAVKVRICRLRKVLGRSAIENDYGRGYRLSTEVRARCSTLLAGVRA